MAAAFFGAKRTERRQRYCSDAEGSDDSPNEKSKHRNHVNHVKDRDADQESNQWKLHHRTSELLPDVFPHETVDGDFSKQKRGKRGAKDKRNHDNSHDAGGKQGNERYEEEKHQDAHKERSDWLRPESADAGRDRSGKNHCG